MALYQNFITKPTFDSFEDFKKNYGVVVPKDYNFGFDVVDVLANKKPEARAILWVGNDGSEKQFSFKDVSQKSNQVANFLVSKGIKKGDKVMLVLKRHYQFWLTIVALHKIGAVVIPATHLLTSKDFEYRCNAAGVRMIICTGDNKVCEFIDEAEQNCKELKLKAVTGTKKAGTNNWIDFDKSIETYSKIFERPIGEKATKSTDMMMLFFTSGTTGYPKMVFHDFTYPLGHILTAKFWQNNIENGLHFTISDTGWGKALWGKIYGQWMCESAVFVYDFEKFNSADILEKIQKHKITTFCAPPTMLRYMIKEDLKSYDLSSLLHTTTAGEALNPEVYTKWLEHTGLKIYEAFGQTETTVVCVTCAPWMEPVLGSMGVSAPGYRVIVADENGKKVEPGVTGEICIQTDEKGGGKPFGLFIGYYRDEDLTKSMWHNDLYHTGDTAYQDEKGFLWYVGRTDDVIKSSGYRIGPFEVESALLEHPAVLEAAITGIEDEIRGIVVKATIVLSKGFSPSSELVKELQNHVKSVTAPYKYPRVIEFVEALPKTISGKIRRVEIRETDRK